MLAGQGRGDQRAAKSHDGHSPKAVPRPGAILAIERPRFLRIVSVPGDQRPTPASLLPDISAPASSEEDGVSQGTAATAVL